MVGGGEGVVPALLRREGVDKGTDGGLDDGGHADRRAQHLMRPLQLCARAHTHVSS